MAPRTCSPVHDASLSARERNTVVLNMRLLGLDRVRMDTLLTQKKHEHTLQSGLPTALPGSRARCGALHLTRARARTRGNLSDRRNVIVLHVIFGESIEVWSSYSTIQDVGVG